MEPKETVEPKETMEPKETVEPKDTTDLSQLSESEKMKIPTIREQEKAKVDNVMTAWAKRNRDHKEKGLM